MSDFMVVPAGVSPIVVRWQGWSYPLYEAGGGKLDWVVWQFRRPLTAAQAFAIRAAFQGDAALTAAPQEES